jgi:L-arabinonolactonase
MHRDKPTPHAIIPATNVLGEGVLWERTGTMNESDTADGANVDADGCMWSAQWGGSSVVRYTPDGRIDQVLEVPESQPTCAAFGGPDRDLLFVSGARDGLSTQELAAQPHAGDLLVYQLSGVRGLPEPRFRGALRTAESMPLG